MPNVPLMAIAPHVGNNGVRRQVNNLPGNIQNNQEGFTRTVDPNELVNTHVEALGASDNRGLRQARMRGMQAGASRGGINSSLAAATGENAWLDGATRMGEQMAGAYQSAAGQNLDSLGRQRLGQEQNATSIATTIHSNDTQAGIARDDRDFNRERDRYNRDWQVSDRTQDREWQVGDRQQERDWNREDDDRNYQRGVETGIVGSALEAARNDPTLRGNPAAFWGFVDNSINESRRILGLPPRPAGPGG